jgi:hypothetical protein
MILCSFCFDNLCYVLLSRERIANQRYRIFRYKISKKLDDVKKRIHEYAFKNKTKLQYCTKSEIEARRKKEWHSQKEMDDFNTLIGEHNMLVDLRNKYLHCSANMDGAGMEPTQDNQSNIIWKRTIIKG